jgi:WD40 repeat protein
LATGGDDRTVRVWDPGALAAVGRPFTEHTSRVTVVLAFTTADGRTLMASGDSDGTFFLWDPDSGNQVGAPFSGHVQASHHPAISAGTAFTLPSRQVLLATGDYGGTVLIWDPVTGTRMGVPMTGHSAGAFDIAAFTDQNGRTALAVGCRQKVLVWDPLTGTQTGEIFVDDDTMVYAVATFRNPDGHVTVVTGSIRGSIQFWDAANGRELSAPRKGHTNPIMAVAPFTTREGRVLVASAGGFDHTVRIWDPHVAGAIPPTAADATIMFHKALTFTDPSGHEFLAMSDRDKVTSVWDADGLLGNTAAGDGSDTFTLFTDASGRLTMAVGAYGYFWTWDPATAESIASFSTGISSSVDAVTAFSAADGRVLLATGSSETVQIWDPEAADQAGVPLLGHTGAVMAIVAFESHDGRVLLATGSQDGTVRIWDTADATTVGEPLIGRPHLWILAIAAFQTSSGRALVVTGDYDGTLRIWDPILQTVVDEQAHAHANRIHSLVVFETPDGRTLLISGAYDGAIRIWNPLPLTCLLTVTVGSPVESVAACQSDEPRSTTVLYTAEEGYARFTVATDDL